MPATGNEPVKISQFKSWITGKLSGFLTKPAQDGSAGDVLTLGAGGATVWSKENSGTTFNNVEESSKLQGYSSSAMFPSVLTASDTSYKHFIGLVFEK